MAKLTYGLKNEKLQHIDDVEQGLKCDCVCPNCKEKLIARQGEINEHHFAHSAKECDITVAQESALHIMAKEILEEYKIIKLPKFKLHSKTAFLPKKEFNELDVRLNKDTLTYDYENGEEYVLKFNTVYVEQKQKDIIPDLICEYNGNKFYIEIAITNFIGEAKANKIQEQNISTIEIDLSEYKDKIETMTKRRLADILIDDIELKKWIYDSKYKTDINSIITNNKINLEKQLQLFEECSNMFLPENYFRNQYRYGDNNHALNFWKKQRISENMKMPWYIGYHIYGDFIFELDRRIWQSFIINLIYGSKFSTNPTGIWNYMKDKTFLKINPNFIKPIWISKEMKFSGLDVVRQYYEFLQSSNVINEKGLFNNGK
jgi:hypothetical protein